MVDVNRRRLEAWLRRIVVEDLAHGQAQFLQTCPQRISREPENLGRPRLMAADRRQNLLQQNAIDGCVNLVAQAGASLGEQVLHEGPHVRQITGRNSRSNS